jgi:hypothetical protein
LKRLSSGHESWIGAFGPVATITGRLSSDVTQ